MSRSAIGGSGRGEGWTFVVGSMVALVTAEPYLRAALDRTDDVWLVAPDDVAAHARRVVPALERTARPVCSDPADRALRLLHTGLAVLLADRPFKTHLSALRDPRRARGGLPSRILLAISTATARMPPPVVNRLLDRLLRLVQRNPYPTRDVVAVSYPPLPHRLCARDQRVVTVMESWDHASKKAAGYVSDAVVAWNGDLGRDWQHGQGAQCTVVGYPVKLRYAIEHQAPETAGRTLMYAAGTSANTDRPGWYADELEVIEELCAATSATGWELLIKPKPNGRVGDFDAVAARHAHVRVGTYRDAADAVDYYLDDTYNEARMADLAACSMVVNCWTTFALDAALAGRPVLQLDLRQHRDRWPALAQAMHNHHLATYLLGDQPGVIRPDPAVPLRDALAKVLADPSAPAEAFRDHLRSWLLPGRAADAAVAAVLDELTR